MSADIGPFVGRNHNCRHDWTSRSAQDGTLEGLLTLPRPWCVRFVHTRAEAHIIIELSRAAISVDELRSRKRREARRAQILAWVISELQRRLNDTCARGNNRTTDWEWCNAALPMALQVLLMSCTECWTLLPTYCWVSSFSARLIETPNVVMRNYACCWPSQWSVCGLGNRSCGSGQARLSAPLN